MVEQTLGFIQRELTAPEGGFYSSLDADSEGEEGKFYVWTEAEIDSVLADQQLSERFKAYYNIKPNGNWEHKKNILFRTDEMEVVAQKVNTSSETLLQDIATAKGKLFSARDQRIRPLLDDKVLTSWNALMLKGYVDAYKAIGNQEYLNIALKNAQFLKERMQDQDGRLNRNYKDGKSVINAFLDDYAHMIHAYLSLYEVTFEES